MAWSVASWLAGLVSIALATVLWSRQKRLAESEAARRDLERSLRVMEEERHVLELIASGATLTEVLERLTLAIEAIVPEATCSVLLVDRERKCLTHGVAPHLPAEFWRHCDGLPIGDFGCCPAAVLHNRITISEDMLIDPKWESARDGVRAVGLRSCWSVPIQGSETREVIGTFAMYRTVPASPTPEDLRVVSAAARLAGNAIERLRWVERARDFEERFALAEHAAGFGIWEWDPATNIFNLSEGTARAMGGGARAGHISAEQLYVDGASGRPRVCPAGSRHRAAGGWLRTGVPAHLAPRRLDPVVPQQGQRGDRRRQAGQGDRRHPGHHPREGADAQPGTCQVDGRSGRPGEERVPGQHEPRDPHADERRDRHDRTAAGTDLTQEQRDFVETIRSSGEALLTVINDILDFSKIEAGKLSLEIYPFELDGLLEEVVEMLGPGAGEKGIDLVLNYPPSCPRRFQGDADRVRQLVVNLAANAVKFTHQGQVVISVEPHGGSSGVMISVADTGIGIAAEQLASLFEKFTQADPSTTRRYGGTGLGLSIAKSLAELMGRYIGAQSTVGTGSTFTVTLPLQSSDEPIEAPGVPSFRLRGLRVLIVDDNHVNRRVIHQHINCWGMRNGSYASADRRWPRFGRRVPPVTRTRS